jgi:hypothetical protein
VELFRQSLGITYPLFNDESEEISRVFNVTVTSTTFIISPDFVLREKVEDGTTRGYLERMWTEYGKGAP